jgi:prophage maintenance system killer protein/prophage antirepressor-like protein
MSHSPTPSSELIIYKAKDGSFELDAKLKEDTIWLSQSDIASLFSVNVPAVSKHIKNIFKDGELEPKSTLSKMETVRKEGKREVKRAVEFFNLDMILSIGYRVNSKRATQFRIWATQLLKQHLTKGYTLNPNRLEEAKLAELKSAVTLIRKAMDKKQLSADESAGLLKIITEYAHTWSMLDQFDRKELAAPDKQRSAKYMMEYEEAQTIIRSLKKHLVRQRQAGEEFGQERGSALKELLEDIALRFAGKDASVEEKAAHLLYDFAKKHVFEDGNKRIAVFLFIVYLTRSQYLSDWDGERKFNDNALVALVLLIAESEDSQKELMMKLVMNFVHGR